MTSLNYAPKNSEAFKYFTAGSFILASAMMAGGIYFMEASFAAKGFYAMSALMLVHTAISITKMLRDDEESNWVYNKLEDAKTEKILMEINQDEV